MSLDLLAVHLALRNRALGVSVAATTPFARASTATYTDVAGVVQTAAIDVLRDAHYVGGVLQPPLIEAAATNSVLWASDFNNAAWTKSNVTVTPGIADPAGGTSACTMTATAAASHFDQHLADGSSIARTSSIWLRRRTGSGNVPLYDPMTSAFTNLALTADWQRFSKVGPAGMTRWLYVIIGTSGDAVDAWLGQIDDGPLATSGIQTTTQPVTRAADIDSLFSATATGYARQTGSFLTEGFYVGEEITPLGFTTNTVDTIKGVTALTLTTTNARAVETALAGRSISVKFPALHALENNEFKPVAGHPYVEEDFVPATSTLLGARNGGYVYDTGLYVLKIFGLPKVGVSALRKTGDALKALFAPGTALVAGSSTVRVRTDTSTQTGQIIPLTNGFSVLVLTIPWRAESINAVAA